MAVHANIHFCLIGSPAPKVESGAHPRLVGVIDVTMRVGHASVTVSGEAAAVRGALKEMLDAALLVVPLVADAAEPPKEVL